MVDGKKVTSGMVKDGDNTVLFQTDTAVLLLQIVIGQEEGTSPVGAIMLLLGE